MICEHCGSSNTQPQIVKEDKLARVFRSALMGFLITFLAILIVGIITENAIVFLFIGFGIAVFVGHLVGFIALLIPAKEYTVFVCCDCGEITEM
ncbi:MAG: hypothetical protein IJY97_11090 [Clostridia bacterium]|nr:hypothetical protein [Clostridia bacterium]